MRIIFVRHGESEGNRFGLVQGHLDFQLSSEGRGQAKKTVDVIRRLIGDKKPLVFSSDLLRAWETAMIICEELKLNLPIPDQRLRERDMGNLQNLHWTAIDWDTINSNDQPAGVLESRQDFILRIKNFLKFVLGQKKTVGETVIAVTHGGTLTFIYHLLLETDLNKVPYIRNAAAHVFNITEERDNIKGIVEVAD